MKRLCALFQAALVAAFLCACGGGGDSPAKPQIDFWGDSITSGTIALPDGTVTKLAVTPVARINELAAGRFVAIDLALPGMTTQEALDGGFRWLDFGPSRPLRDVVASSPAQTVVFRYGTADALRGLSPDLFRSNLRELVRLTRAAGKRPVLVEPIYQLPPVAERADALCAVVHEVASADGVQLIPIRDLPWALADGVHPDQATADRMVARIVEALR